ncbi:copper amine oxidase N-terminal domain-containing protein [Kyrpidia tusciae]|uniref:Copper amine oxidase domain protein n=1 Tax=Kyrpidia tusciae (strain DSM 2912 / NBRC 15312 / T2) TaxID=562970 RepID=D5WVI5_KYRT2|nr:copper amine oxidase N-terminal domain-containing protein [Kyrpidia tusciae]ADG05595.1 copper amine oxidase domain protein [Kyrpidia tusciae DSM 2912]
MPFPFIPRRTIPIATSVVTTVMLLFPPAAVGADAEVPLRSAAEAQGALVTWDEAGQTAIIEKQGHRLLVRVGAHTASLDGKPLPVSSEIHLVQDRAAVPQSVMDAFIQAVNSGTPESRLLGRYILKNPKELGNGIRMSIGSSLTHDSRRLFGSPRTP